MKTLKRVQGDKYKIMLEIELKTERLIIKTMQRENIPQMFPHIKNNYQLTRHMCWEPPNKIEETYQVWEEHLKTNKETYRLAIFHDGDFVGRIGVRDINLENKSADFGFWIAPTFQGQGFGTEALREIARFVFEDLNLEKLTGCAFTENKTSQRVFEKVGFTKIGTIKNVLEKRGKMIDEFSYELLKKDFKL